MPKVTASSIPTFSVPRWPDKVVFWCRALNCEWTVVTTT
jgi:hypothetical protein